MTTVSWRFVTLAGFFVTTLVVSNIIAVKLVWETLATPFTYLIANGLKRAEGVDVFDGPRPAEARA